MSVERERERDRSPEKQSDFKVFVGGISWHTTDQELADSKHPVGCTKPVEYRQSEN